MVVPEDDEESTRTRDGEVGSRQRCSGTGVKVHDEVRRVYAVRSECCLKEAELLACFGFHKFTTTVAMAHLVNTLTCVAFTLVTLVEVTQSYPH